MCMQSVNVHNLGFCFLVHPCLGSDSSARKATHSEPEQSRLGFWRFLGQWFSPPHPLKGLVLRFIFKIGAPSANLSEPLGTTLAFGSTGHHSTTRQSTSVRCLWELSQEVGFVRVLSFLHSASSGNRTERFSVFLRTV